MDADKLKYLTELVDPTRRGEAALRVAALYGSESIILFIRDEAIGLSLPVGGFPQTLPNGTGWRIFLERCVKNKTAQEILPAPGSHAEQLVIGIACNNGAVMAFIGGTLLDDAYSDIPAILPLLDLALKGEQAAIIAEANARLAAERIAIAHRLAESLDKARLDLAKILIESRAAQQELKMADQRKNEFLALLAHELRNPLAPIGNALELLRMSVEKPEMINKVQEIMQTQLTQMVRLIDDLMDVSRISTGKILLKKVMLNVSDVFSGAIEAVRPQFEANGQKLEVHVPATYSCVLADPTRLNQVFINILNNAAKFTPRGGRISVAVSPTESYVDVSVTDTGKGVPKEIASQIFTMFAQGDDTISRTSGGLGIGLGLAKNIVDLHEGTITVVSDGKDKGSTFTVRLPLHTGAMSNPEPAETPTMDRAPVALRFLIVDDNKESAQTMGWTVEMLGHEYRLAFDGQTALEIAQTYSPQLILLDIGLPGMTGYEVCAAMKNYPTLRSSLFIAQTGWGQAQDKENAKTAGFDYHLVKPVNIEELKRIIEMFALGPVGDRIQSVERT